MSTSTSTRPGALVATVQHRRFKIVHRARLRVAGVLATAAFLVAGATQAHAATTGTAEAAITAGFGELQGLVSGVLAVSLFGITVLILAIVMGIKWLGKGAKAN